MKVIIAGGRDFSDYGFLTDCLEEYRISEYPITKVVCGKAKGADTLGEIWAKEKYIPIHYEKAHWDIYGKKAGIIRNQRMGDYADCLVAFWDHKSRGTKYMIEYMRKLNKPVSIFPYN